MDDPQISEMPKYCFICGVELYPSQVVLLQCCNPDCQILYLPYEGVNGIISLERV